MKTFDTTSNNTGSLNLKYFNFKEKAFFVKLRLLPLTRLKTHVVLFNFRASRFVNLELEIFI